MKKNFIFIAFLFCSVIFMQAQVELTVEHVTTNNMDAEITTALGSTEISTITKLKITGDANLSMADCHAIRDRFLSTLFILDLSEAKFADNKIPDGVAVDGVAQGAFSAMKIEEVIFPAGLVEVGDRAFHSCDFLIEATMPNSVTRIGTYTFFKCLELTLAVLPENLETLEAYAFQDCRNLTLSSLPSGLKGTTEAQGTLGARTFQTCSNITISELPAGIKALGGYVFQNCRKIPSMTFPAGFESIGNRTFNGCTGLGELRFKGTTPPACTLPSSTGTNNDSFLDTEKDSIVVYVPTGSRDAFNKSPWSDMKSITEYDPSSSISAVDANLLSFYIDYVNGNIVINKEFDSSPISIYDITGNLILNKNINNSNKLNISHLPKGVYIINTGKTSTKFIW